MARVRVLQFLDGVVVSAPGAADISASQLVKFPDDASYEAVYGPGEPGDIYYNTTDDEIRYYQDDEWTILRGGAGAILISAYGLNATPLDTGSVIIDDYQVVAGDRVVWPDFNSKVYEALGVGSNITGWEVQELYALSTEDPQPGESVRIINGTSFGTQLATFDGTSFTINEKVRYFVGANYWEQSGIYETTLTNNSTGAVFTVTAQQSENLVVNYSVSRGPEKRIGQVLITHSNVIGDVPTVDVGGSTADLGIEFQAEISGTDLLLNYTTTDLGSDAQVKYFISRWSDAAGGPGTPPSYTPSTGGTVPAAGNPGEIQFGGGSGNITANANLSWNDTSQALQLGALSLSTLQQATLFDNQTDQIIFTIPVADARHLIIEYSIARGNDSRVGRKIIFANVLGSVTESEDFVEPVSTGITLDSDISAGFLRFKYSSSATGQNAVFKYALRYWA